MNWFKLYSEFAVDPKVQTMSESMQRRLIMLFCLESSGDLRLLDDGEIATTLRISRAELTRTRELFIARGFLADDRGWVLKNWARRQASSDPGAAERMRRMRDRRLDELRELTAKAEANGAVTGPHMPAKSRRK